MQPIARDDRPPYVQFETKVQEDREASLKNGTYVGKDVDYAIITPSGSKDRIYREVKEWFSQKESDVAQGRFKREWLAAYKEAYKAFKEGRDIPLQGTPVVNWPVASPAQVRNLLEISIKTVEDVAAMNEEAIARLGMGGRALRDMAQNWLLANGSDQAKVAGKLSALQAQVGSLAATVTALQEQNEMLKSALRAANALPESQVQSPSPAALSSADLLSDD